ncbi:MAG: class I SAM-dependent methyltransferase [Anaerolineae bacterium]|nr:class I SAM-dependent methyltransferase [Anaerolineae bacterium]
MAEFARRITPRLIDFAQHLDWLGRRIVVLGCGTGASIEYLSQYPYTITGIDNSPEMLELAKRKLSDPGLSLRWQQLDIRELNLQGGLVDLVLTLNTLNEMNSLRELETVFGAVQRVLESEKLFIFDMMTVQGLTEAGMAGDDLLYDAPASLSVVATNEYDHERQMQTTHYLVFQRQGEGWQRKEARRVLRAFPVQAIGSLLQRAGFTIRRILDENLEIYEPGVSRAGRVIFIASKQ